MVKFSHKIGGTFTSRSSGEEISFVYHENDPYLHKEDRKLAVVHGFCITREGNMVLVNHPKSGWCPPGGGVEDGEDIFTAVEREVLEETNMKVIHKEYIGSVDFLHNNERHVRFFCFVEALGPFVSDPDGEIMEIKEVEATLENLKKEFDWGPAGERLINVALDKFNTLQSKEEK